MKIKTLTSIALLAFVFLFASVVLFGKFGTAIDAPSTNTFMIGYFMLFIFLLGAVYISKIDLLKTVIEHVVAILGILIIAYLLTISMVQIKDAYTASIATSGSKEQLQNEVNNISASNNDLTTLENALKVRLASVQQNNKELQAQIQQLSAIQQSNVQNSLQNNQQTTEVSTLQQTAEAINSSQQIATTNTTQQTAATNTTPPATTRTRRTRKQYDD